MSLSACRKSGKVYLVGAGPGDPGLITLKGVDCLQRADLVLYDYLVNAEVLRHVPPHAELVCLGHHPQRKGLDPAEIHSRLIEAARQGKTVVRLKGGDPDVFGRSAEETEALSRAGVSWETVPGVTAALAAAAYAGIPITHPAGSSAVGLVTGQQRHGKSTAPLDYGALADFPGTLVFYMGVTTASHWAGALIARGKAPTTPVAIVRRCSWSDQTTIRCTLGTLVEVIAQRHVRPPAVIVVGEVVSRAPEVSWFAARPLFGTRVLVTRAADPADTLSAQLAELGAEVLAQPAIEIFEPADWGPVDRALARLGQFNWLVFSSSHGVSHLLDRLEHGHGDLRALGGIRIAAIGPGTAQKLRQYRLRADLVPEPYRAEALAEALAPEARGCRFLLARASRGREVLAEQLAAAGGSVEQIVVYQSADVAGADPRVAAALAHGRVDWITVTSSAIARALVRLFGSHLHRARLASISPITSDVLRKLGFGPAAEAVQYTMEGVVRAITEGNRR
jgi:uroporphyrinogen III methyltransferase/synthase